MSTQPWPPSLRPYAPQVSASCGHRVPLGQAFVMGDEQTTYCDDCLLLVACSDGVRTAALGCVRCHKAAPAPEHLYQLGDDRWYCLPCIVERYSDAELAVHQERIGERDDAYTMVAHLRHISFHREPVPGCEWCVVRA